MRSIWSGAIGFGLVNIPVKLFSAVSQSDLDLDMLDKKDHANIRFKRVNEKTGKEVAWENIVRGYNLDGQYVILSDEDFKKASPEKTKIIEIAEFVDEDKIDSMYFETPYYLEPQKAGVKAYGLLRDALKKSGKTGLASFVLRTKESLGLIKVIDKMLILQKIRYEQEIRKPEGLEIPDAESKPAELKMAIALIDQLSSSKFDISKYKDTYSDELMKLIEAKAKGKKIVAPTMRVVHSKSKDLMEQLKASLETKKKKAS
ncbi:MAG TPA: Ku protein [Flavitalea sp.]|jgi:DNA end-binding protein Ku|nr:Ku protein [Flavitalea sp.]